MQEIKWLFKSVQNKLLIAFFIILASFFIIDFLILSLPLIYANILDTAKTMVFPINDYLLWLFLTISLLTAKLYTKYYNKILHLKINKLLIFKVINNVFKQNKTEFYKEGSEYYNDIILNKTSVASSLFDIEGMTGIINLYKLVVITIIIFSLDIVIGFCALILSIISFFVYKYANRYYMKENSKIFNKSMNYYSDIEDTFSGKNEIESYNSFDYEINRNSLKYENIKKHKKRVFSIDFINFFVLLDYLRVAFELFTLVFALFSSFDGKYSIGTAIVLIVYSTMISEPIMYLSSILSGIRDSILSLKIISNFYEKKDTPKKLITEIKSVEFKDVNFSLDKKEILKNINFHIKNNEKLGLFAPSGSGKTTIANLILKEVLSDKGKIEINGTNIQNIEQKSIFNNVSVLSQNSYLFPESLYENITMGKNIPQEEIKNILVKLHLDYINLNKKLEKNGENISGGEKSRILLARFLVDIKNKDFFIIDEPLEGIEQNIKEKIVEYLKSQLNEKKGIIISHRKEILNKTCDTIYNLNI